MSIRIHIFKNIGAYIYKNNNYYCQIKTIDYCHLLKPKSIYLLYNNDKINGYISIQKDDFVTYMLNYEKCSEDIWRSELINGQYFKIESENKHFLFNVIIHTQ